MLWSQLIKDFATRETAVRGEFGLPTNKCIFIYGGNLETTGHTIC